MITSLAIMANWAIFLNRNPFVFPLEFFMKVKCQNCWKIFEVSDDSVGKQKTCQYCQRPMTIKANAEEQAALNTTVNDPRIDALDTKIKTLQMFIWIIIALTTLNVILMLIVWKRSPAEEIVMPDYTELQSKLMKQNEILYQQQTNKIEVLFKNFNEDMLKQTKKEFNDLNVQLANIVRQIGSQEMLDAIANKMDMITSKLDQNTQALQKLQAAEKKKP